MLRVLEPDWRLCVFPCLLQHLHSDLPDVHLPDLYAMLWSGDPAREGDPDLLCSFWQPIDACRSVNLLVQSWTGLVADGPWVWP